MCIRDREDIALNDALMQSDGIHPTADAQPIILDNVWPELEPMVEPLVEGPLETTQQTAAN